MHFAEAFEALTGKRPFPWQTRAFNMLAEGLLPTSVNMPTGTGKTSLIPIWLIALAQQAQRASPAKLPRRLVWVVNRRVVVDQATDEAVGMLNRLTMREDTQGQMQGQILQEIVKHLGSLSCLGRRGREPVSISTLRGQLADNGEWAIDPSRPAIVIGTVDMIGSRLLFSGYGNGKSLRPLHAGLLGQDAWIVLDEAHLTPAFAELLGAIKSFQQAFPKLAPFCVSLLSATQRLHKLSETGECISINPDDEIDRVIGKRLAAEKLLRIHQLGEGDDEGECLGKLALNYREAKVRVLVYVKSPMLATKLVQVLARDSPECPVRLLTGTLRGTERDSLAQDPVFSGFRSDPDRGKPEVTHYLVSTSAGEVGADLDADHLVCDLVALDSLIQRFGRVNRLGLGTANVDLVVPAKADKEENADRALAFLKTLPQAADGCYSVSPRNLTAPLQEAFGAAPPTVPLARHWLDMWSLTSIRDKDWLERPDVAPWLHGVVPDLPETWVAWREDVEWLAEKAVAEVDCAKALDAYPIRPHEQLREPTRDIRDKLRKLVKIRDNATRPVVLIGRDGDLVWRGLLEKLLVQESDGIISIRYGTVLLPPSAGGLSKEGFFSPGEATASDVADGFDLPRRRRRFFAQRVEDDWSALQLVGSNDDSTEYEAESLSNLISLISRRTSLKMVATVQLGGHDESEDEANRYLLYFADPASVALCSAASFVSRGKQLLTEHTNQVGTLLHSLAQQIGLPEDYQSALNLAGCGHDMGKNRRCWQRAIGNPDASTPLAKSGHAHFAQLFNGHYRHEFGSLLETGKSESVSEHPHRDLILHLVASHHGHARPHFREDAFDRETAFRTCQDAALETCQRFGRLQAQYGWWALAWIEALLKAADALVSGGYVSGENHE